MTENINSDARILREILRRYLPPSAFYQLPRGSELLECVTNTFGFGPDNGLEYLKNRVKLLGFFTLDEVAETEAELKAVPAQLRYLGYDKKQVRVGNDRPFIWAEKSLIAGLKARDIRDKYTGALSARELPL